MIDIGEVKRYLNIKSEGKIDQELIEFFDKEIEANINPRLISGEFGLSKTDDGYLLNGTNIVLKGKLIDKTLKQCDNVVLFAATLTAVSDNMIREYSIKDMAKAVILNACLSVYLEQFADDFQTDLKLKLISENRGITRRISCGYGDFSLAYQQDFIELLRADKYLGIQCSDSNMLTPIKSITALIGTGKKINNDEQESSCCGACGAECNYRKEK